MYRWDKIGTTFWIEFEDEQGLGETMIAFDDQWIDGNLLGCVREEFWHGGFGLYQALPSDKMRLFFAKTFFLLLFAPVWWMLFFRLFHHAHVVKQEGVEGCVR